MSKRPLHILLQKLLDFEKTSFTVMAVSEFTIMFLFCTLIQETQN